MSIFKRKRHLFSIKEMISPFLIFLCFVGLFLFGVSCIEATSEDEQLQLLSKAITRASVNCYAVEGRYPPSIKYLEEHYGLIINHKKFFVDYMCFASNIMPEITVVDKSTGLYLIEK